MESSDTTVMSTRVATDQQQLLVDPSLEPQMRNRCNTWPLRPIIDPPSVHDSESNPPTESVIKEEPEDFLQTELDDETQSQHNLSGGPDSSNANISNQLGINNSSELGSQGDLNAKKQSARKNAWGNLSYADLITKAIQSSPEKRLTLSQIYDWMVQNVSYFRDKGDSNSSAGWKNSIRHNLSLHNRFMRIQNEGAGKSSWWVINPDAKHGGKAPRRPRGGSMDSSKSMGMKASRDRAMKKVRELKNKGLLNKDGTSPVSPANDFTLSPGDSSAYRDRASSFASSIGGRRSPLHDDILDAKLSPWGSENRLDTDYQMDTKLSDNMDLSCLTFPELQTGSLLNELEDISEPYNEPATTNMAAHGNFLGKPYTSYLQGTESTGSYPPPPYPDASTEQQAFSKQNMAAGSVTQPMYNKDPMLTNYNPNNGNNNNHRSQFPGGYTNGILPSQTMAQQHARLTQPRMSQAQQRVLPNSIRAALGSNPPATRANQISQSLKESAPILSAQLLDYQSATQQQTMFSQGQGPQANRQQQPMAFTSYPASAEQVGFSYASNGVNNSSQNSNSYFPSDIDIENMPELLPCDVEEIIREELRMDGGQLDFAGFEGYTSSNQQQQQTPNSQSGNGNVGIGLS